MSEEAVAEENQARQRAANKVRRLVDEEANPDLKLRFRDGWRLLWFQYGLPSTKLPPKMMPPSKKTVSLVIDPQLVYLAGAQVDYEEGIAGSKFGSITQRFQ